MHGHKHSFAEAYQFRLSVKAPGFKKQKVSLEVSVGVNNFREIKLLNENRS